MIWFYVFGLLGGCTGAFFGRLLANNIIEKRKLKKQKEAQEKTLSDCMREAIKDADLFPDGDGSFIYEVENE